ncbi:hypothetical protein [Flavobacterium sp. NRK F7]|uniref:hypothetical protein n=1 Tax=Flavobacterium sp. NRK F7 TaxID=2954930 RepID=UPI0020910014|nr:hypothetical protein [Flavobacterium sp. NRK F7]MCO6161786.1 hypothetical protein [Flavobacterium sp. NRK F7]
MRKGTFILILSLFFINCKENTKTIDKTYEQLEAEVLCDVLPEIIPPFIQLDLVPPQPQSSDLLNKIDETFSEDDSIVINLKSKLEYIKKLAKEKNKIYIGLNSLMFSINKSEFNCLNQNQIMFDSIKERKIRNNEIVKSTLKIKLLDNDTIASMGEFILDRNLTAMISTTRVLFNKTKSKAYFKLHPFGCLPYSIEVMAEKINNKWTVKEIVK